MAGSKTINDLFTDELRDVYHAEKQLTRALPKMAKAASSATLRQAFESHLEETRGQIERLEQIFDELDLPARAKRCEAMAGLLEEGKELMDMDLLPEVKDAALIAAAQKVEHYEIASYGTLRAMAEACGFSTVAQLLQQTLDEEQAADTKLNELATKDVNKKAVQVSGKKAA